ncbi:MAG: cytochrome c-type biogenesis protein CcmH, partial [Bryobacteraceae bacterium]
KTRLLFLLLAAASIAQTSSELISPDVRRVGSRLACLCGSCKNTVGDCPMLQCHYSGPARERIGKLQGMGASDDNIVGDFVRDTGMQALSSPPTSGFQLLAWVTPFAAIFAGLIAIWLYMRRYRPSRPAAVEIDPAVLDQYRDRIEKDMAKLD